jgi:hypothetical protein
MLDRNHYQQQSTDAGNLLRVIQYNLDEKLLRRIVSIVPASSHQATTVHMLLLCCIATSQLHSQKYYQWLLTAG